jgi:hypothetical protein
MSHRVGVEQDSLYAQANIGDVPMLSKFARDKDVELLSASP